jgi:hypothetical protein
MRNAVVISCCALLLIGVALGDSEEDDEDVYLERGRHEEIVPAAAEAEEEKDYRSISNAKHMFSTINTGFMLPDWKDEEIKKVAGKNAWGDWRPANGMVGEVIQSWGCAKHLLRIDDKYVIAAEEGLDGDCVPSSNLAESLSQESTPAQEGGGDSEEIITWAKSQKLAIPGTEDVWSWNEKTMTHITGAAQWKSWRSKHPKAMVLFFAPWCHHCANLKPAWEAAAKLVHQGSGEAGFGVVDCTSSTKMPEGLSDEGEDICTGLGVSPDYILEINSKLLTISFARTLYRYTSSHACSTSLPRWMKRARNSYENKHRKSLLDSPRQTGLSSHWNQTQARHSQSVTGRYVAK